MRFTLVRGLTRDKFHWARFPSLLGNAFPKAAIEMLDLPGNGEHCGITSPIRPRDYVEFLRQHSEFVRKKQKTTIVAVSLGAMIAYEWTKHYPNEIEALVFLNTSMRPTPTYRRMRPEAILRLGEMIAEKDFVARERKVLELTTTLLSDKLESYAVAWGAHAQKYPTKKLSLLNQLLAAAQIRRGDTPPPVPTLILRSLEDHMVNPVCSEDIARAWKVPLETHWAAGHDLTLDAPEWVVKKIEKFKSSPPNN
jgi:pimeloyl-ACP methyl ester carboxylesterase